MISNCAGNDRGICEILGGLVDLKLIRNRETPTCPKHSRTLVREDGLSAGHASGVAGHFSRLGHASHGVGRVAISAKLPNIIRIVVSGSFWPGRRDHVRWQGCTLWDLIMPAFLFMVGVALPFSIASRRRRGQGSARLFAHAVWRSVVLVLLGILHHVGLASRARGSTSSMCSRRSGSAIGSCS